jgi:hypothetical protein
MTQLATTVQPSPATNAQSITTFFLTWCAYSKQQKTTKGHDTDNRLICNSVILCKFARLLHSKNIHSINLHKMLNDVSIH